MKLLHSSKSFLSIVSLEMFFLSQLMQSYKKELQSFFLQEGCDLIKKMFLIICL